MLPSFLSGVARRWLAPTCVLALAAAPRAQDVAAADAVAAILARPAPAEESAAELARVAGGASPWLEARASGRLVTSGGTSTLTPEQQRVLRLSGPGLASAEALGAVRAALGAGRGSEAMRLAALELLGWHASASDVSLLVAVATSDEPANAAHAEDDAEEPPLFTAFEEALVAILRRDLRAYADLHHTALRAGALRSSLVRAVGRAGDPRGLDWLAGEIQDGQHGDLALIEVGRLASRASADQAGPLAELLLPFLSNDTASRRAHAARALGSLGADRAVPQLVLLLCSEARGERRTAHAALRAITGRNLPDVPETWIAWYKRELTWFEEEAPAVVLRLQSEDEGEVAAAARTLSGRGLQRRQLSVELARLLATHPSAAVRAEACAGLARLSADVQQEALLDSLHDEDEGVRQQACAALRTLTGLALGPDEDEWRAALSRR